MKVHYLLAFIALAACSKKENINSTTSKKSVEQNCFIVSQGINFDDTRTTYSAPTNEDILNALPKHIQQKQLTDFQNFSYDQKQTDELKKKEKQYFASDSYQTKFQEWIKALPEFNYLSVNENFALAKNKYGLWIVEKNENQFKPYFLGLTQNFYLNDFYKTDQKFIQNNQFVASGTIVNIQRLSRVPMLPKYEVIKDGIEFSIPLDDIRKDSDGDGYNDLFEEFIGLNPSSKDTDGDGISDFEDSNPKFKSETTKFTSMYETIVDEPSEKLQYSFTEILTDCDYFHSINPKNLKVLVYKTDEKVPLKEDVIDNFFARKYSKMSTNKDFPEVYFTDFSDESGNGTYSAEYKDGKWKVDKKYTITFGM